MKATILGIALLFAVSVSAQSTPSSTMQTAKGDRHACIMADDATWTSLGLSKEQMTRVHEIQAACKSNYSTAKDADSKTASVSKHEGELKAVLTPEQFEKWQKWCADRKTTSSTTPATPAEKK